MKYKELLRGLLNIEAISPEVLEQEVVVDLENRIYKISNTNVLVTNSEGKLKLVSLDSLVTCDLDCALSLCGHCKGTKLCTKFVYYNPDLAR